jgi:hypothetical protein
MDPLIEVSTVGGKNMRETCARALAAALLTGAIATVVGMAAHLGPPTDTGGPIAAPPSPLERTVRLTVRPAPKPSRRAARVVTVTTIHVPPPPPRAATPRLVVTKHRGRRPAPKRQLAATAPAPPPPTTTEAQPPAPAQDPPGNQGHGHAYGRDKHDGQDDQGD